MDGVGAGLRLPQLPKLDQRDIDTVRSFLPGKLLSRTAALLSLVLLVLGFAGAVDWTLEHQLDIHLRSMPWLRAILLGGLPLLAVAAQIAAEWQADRQRRRMRELALRPSEVPQGYFRIGPYQDTESDRAQFDRADKAHLKMLDWIKGRTSLPLYLTGDSGSGKSSLLNAFVLPRLREDGWTVVGVRAWQDPEAALREALSALPGMRRARAGETLEVRELIVAAARRAPAGVLLVLDQFEEFVILGTDDARGRFVALLEILRTAPVPGVRVLLTLRSDYEAQIEECGLPLLRQGENHFPVGRFSLAAAHGFMAHSSLGLSAAQLDRLLTSAAALDETPGLIRPITLNVLGAVLSAGYATAPGFDAGLLIQRYIAQTIAQPALRDHAAKVLEELITAYGTRRPVAETDLARVTKLRRGEVRAVMNGLAAAGLARPLDGEQAVWELAHDFIARAVARQLGRHRRDHWRHGLAYASPLLLAATVVCGSLAVAWHWFGPLQLRSELAELGLTVTIEADHADAEVNSHFTEQHFAQAAPLLARLNASVPIRSFDMSDEYFDSVEPLRGLTALTTLDLSGTGIKDVTPLRGLTALTSLNLSNTQAVDLEPLKDMAGLRELNLFGTPAARLEPLKRLTALTTLKLSNGPVANIEPLRHLTALRELYLPGTQVADLEPLRGLTELRELFLYRTPVANLEPLRGLTTLTRLDLTGTQVEDLGPLHGLTALTMLGLGQTRVGDVAPLSGLTALETLSVTSDRVTSLEPLRRLTGLKALFLSGRRITDLAPLAALTALTTLDLANTRVVDLAPLSGLASLTRLNLAGTPAVDLEPLKALTTLTALCLSDTRVVDLAPVQDLPKLHFINPTGAGAAPPVERRELERFAAYRTSRSLPAAW